MNETFDFKEVYLSWFLKMKHFAKEYVISDEDAENIVQDVFVELWEKRPMFADGARLAAYLYKAVKNKSLNCLRRRILEQAANDRTQDEYEAALRVNMESLEFFDYTLFNEEDAEHMLRRIIRSLPERCRQIFVMNKLEGKKQKDIAAELHISVNTVETQISIAYKKLKAELRNYLPLLVLLFSAKLF